MFVCPNSNDQYFYSDKEKPLRRYAWPLRLTHFSIYQFFEGSETSWQRRHSASIKNENIFFSDHYSAVVKVILEIWERSKYFLFPIFINGNIFSLFWLTFIETLYILIARENPLRPNSVLFFYLCYVTLSSLFLYKTLHESFLSFLRDANDFASFVLLIFCKHVDQCRKDFFIETCYHNLIGITWQTTHLDIRDTISRTKVNCCQGKASFYKWK